jgi:ferrous iron transport protein B
VKSKGIAELLERAVQAALSGKSPRPLRYGAEMERAISRVAKMFGDGGMKYSKRWLAIKLLQNDEEVRKMPIDRRIISEAGKTAKSIEHACKRPCPTAMACEIYAKAAKIAKAAQRRVRRERGLSERFDDISTHRLWGYPLLAAVLLAVFFSIFTAGNFLAGLIEQWFSVVVAPAEQLLPGIAGALLMAVAEGIIATLSVVVPYILPLYLILGILENSGYLARIAFLMDSAMHKIGLHGKAFIPLMMGYGCNVPACLGCRIMETHRERLIAVFVTTLIPCAAVTTVILGLVGRFVSIWWALGLYIIDALIVFALGRIAFKVLPGEPVGLIMEMPSYRMPHYRTVIKQTWFRVRDFVYIAFPIIIASTVTISILDFAGVLGVMEGAMAPVTVAWLGLPAVTGILLIFGTLKKELTLVMLAAYLGTTNFALALTPIQMIVFALVTMLYIPCAAVIAALVKEIGWKRALCIAVFEILFAILVGGIAYRLLLLQ